MLGLGYNFLDIVLKKKNHILTINNPNFNYFIKSLNKKTCTLTTLYKYAEFYDVKVQINFIGLNKKAKDKEIGIGTYLKSLIQKSSSFKDAALLLNIKEESFLQKLRKFNNTSFNLKELFEVINTNNFQFFFIVSNGKEKIRLNLNEPIGNLIETFLIENYDIKKIMKYHFLSHKRFKILMEKFNNKKLNFSTFLDFFKFDKNIVISHEIFNYENSINLDLDKKFLNSLRDNGIYKHKEISEILNISPSLLTNFLNTLKHKKANIQKIFHYSEKLKLEVKITFS